MGIYLIIISYQIAILLNCIEYHEPYSLSSNSRVSNNHRNDFPNCFPYSNILTYQALPEPSEQSTFPCQLSDYWKSIKYRQPTQQSIDFSPCPQKLYHQIQLTKFISWTSKFVSMLFTFHRENAEKQVHPTRIRISFNFSVSSLLCIFPRLPCNGKIGKTLG